MFEVSKSTLGSVEVYRLQNQSLKLWAEVVPSQGALLNRLQLSKGDFAGEVLEGAKSESELLHDHKKWYKGSLLFPFPNRLQGGVYEWKGKLYQFPINDAIPLQNALHGILAFEPFEVLETGQNEKSAWVKLHYKNKERHQAFPFYYSIEILYTLKRDGITCAAKVTNLGETAFPYGLGWHPYFTLHKPVDLLEMQWPKHKHIKTNKQMIPIGTPENSFLFPGLEPIEGSQFDHGFQIDNDDLISMFIMHDNEKEVSLKIWVQGGEDAFNYFQVFIPPHRQSIAIEPQTCAADAFNNNMGLIVLEPGDHRTHTYGIGL